MKKCILIGLSFVLISVTAGQIPPPLLSVRVIYPNGGETLCPGQTVEILWQAFGGGLATISYSTDNGSTWTTIIFSTPNDGTCSWTVPDAISDDCLIKIVGPNNTDTSDLPFSIAQTVIRVLYPNGEDITAGETLEIQWESTYASDQVEIGYTCEWHYYQIEANVPNNGSYTWDVPCDLLDKYIRIEVKDVAKNVMDLSDAASHIIGSREIRVIYPNGEDVTAGEPLEIRWESSCASDQVKIGFIREWHYYPIEASTPNDGLYTWNVPCDLVDKYIVITVKDTINDIEDRSDAASHVLATLTVLSPNGGEAYCVNQYVNITWNSACLSGRVNILMKRGPLPHWDNVALNVLNTGFYLWRTPGAPCSECIIRVQDAALGAYDDSDTYFVIQGASIQPIYPDGDEIRAGTTTEIRWTSFCADDFVNISYIEEGDPLEEKTIADQVANDGSYPWQVPCELADKRIKVVLEDPLNALKVKSVLFSLVTSDLTLLSPNGGEIWYVGQTYDIRWDAICPPDSVEIGFTPNPYLVPWRVIAVTRGDAFVYSFTVPADEPFIPPDTPSDSCLVRVRDFRSIVGDTSDEYFSLHLLGPMILSPQTGDTLAVGDTTEIRWFVSSEYKTVDLFYSSDSGQTWMTIVQGARNTGRWLWIMPEAPIGDCWIRLCFDGDCIENRGIPIVAPSINLITPNGGEAWCRGNTHQIQWRSRGIQGDVRISLYKDDGLPGDWMVTTPNDGLYEWDISPYLQCGSYLIKIANLSNSLSDMSDAPFSIAPFNIHLLAPNGGEQFCFGGNCPIQWESCNRADSIKIYYSSNNGGDWYSVVSLPDDGLTNEYIWQIPNWTTDQDDFLIKIVKKSNDIGVPTQEDVSDAPFTVFAQCLKFIEPLPGTHLLLGEPVLISWQARHGSGLFTLQVKGFWEDDWQEIASDLTDLSYIWTPQNLANGLYLLRVCDTYDQGVNDVIRVEINGADCSAPSISVADAFFQQNDSGDFDPMMIDITLSGNPNPISTFSFVLNESDYQGYMIPVILDVLPGELLSGYEGFEVDRSEYRKVAVTSTLPVALPAMSQGVLFKLQMTFISEDCHDKGMIALTDLTGDLEGFSACHGMVGCLWCRKGDVHRDDQLNILDEDCAFEHYMRDEVIVEGECGHECVPYAADVVCDGAVTPADAEWISLAVLMSSSYHLPLDCTGPRYIVNDLVLNIPEISAVPGEQVIIPVMMNRFFFEPIIGMRLHFPEELLTFSHVMPSEAFHEWWKLEGRVNQPGVVTIGGYYRRNVMLQQMEDSDPEALTRTSSEVILVHVVFTATEQTGVGMLSLSHLKDNLEFASTTDTRIVVDGKNPTGVAGSTSSIPSSFDLGQNFPNPFNATTVLNIQVPEKSSVSVYVYDLLGRRIKKIAERVAQPGYHKIYWDGTDDEGTEVPSGTFICKMKAEGFEKSIRMTIIK